MRIPVKRALTSAVLILAAGLAVSGCASTSGDPNAPITPLSRYALQVEPGLDRIALAVHDQGLSANQHLALRDLAARYRASGAGQVRIESPAGDSMRTGPAPEAP